MIIAKDAVPFVLGDDVMLLLLLMGDLGRCLCRKRLRLGFMNIIQAKRYFCFE